MANKLGKVVKDARGYKIRIMLASKTFEMPLRDGKVKKETRMLDNGTFGVYAGKNLLKKDFKSVSLANEYIETTLVKK